MNARQRTRDRRDEHVDVSLEEESRTEPPERVSAERVEGDVPEIEQPGEAHHDIQAQ
jgi:hypothetical protein